MKLTKFGILGNKTTSLFTSVRDSKISRGCAKILEILEGRGGGKFGGPILENPEGRGVIRQIPSVGGYGYFLEPHILMSKTFNWRQKVFLPMVTTWHRTEKVNFKPMPFPFNKLQPVEEFLSIKCFQLIQQSCNITHHFFSKTFWSMFNHVSYA